MEIVTTSKLELKLLPEVKLELWHSVRGNFRNLNLNVLNYGVECVFRIWQVSFTSQVFPSSYKQLSIGDHKNSANIFNNSEFILYRTLRWLRCGLTNAWRSHETPFGRLTCITKFNYSIILIYSVYWAIENKNINEKSYWSKFW